MALMVSRVPMAKLAAASMEVPLVLAALAEQAVGKVQTTAVGLVEWVATAVTVVRGFTFLPVQVVLVATVAQALLVVLVPIPQLATPAALAVQVVLAAMAACMVPTAPRQVPLR